MQRLEAFYAGADRGWGLRCTKPIVESQFVVEVLGRCLTEEEQRTLSDDTYAIGFPDNVMDAKRRVGDDLHFIDPKEFGTLFRSSTIAGGAQPARVLALDEANGVCHTAFLGAARYPRACRAHL